jgi:hypothetical protein
LNDFSLSWGLIEKRQAAHSIGNEGVEWGTILKSSFGTSSICYEYLVLKIRKNARTREMR